MKKTIYLILFFSFFSFPLLGFGEKQLIESWDYSPIQYSLNVIGVVGEDGDIISLDINKKIGEIREKFIILEEDALKIKQVQLWKTESAYIFFYHTVRSKDKATFLFAFTQSFESNYIVMTIKNHNTNKYLTFIIDGQGD